MGGQGGCEQRIEVFGEIPKRKKNCGGGLGRGGGGGWGRGGVSGVDVIEELKFWGKFTQKNRGRGGLGGGVRWGSGWWGFEVRVDVNEELKFL